MADQPDAAAASTPPSVAAVAQTRDVGGVGATRAGRAAGAAAGREPGEGDAFDISPRVARVQDDRPYERHRHEPVYRPLKIFALDPARSKFEGATALLRVPYEPLLPGPEGAVLRVEDNDGRQTNAPVDLDAQQVLINGGLDPTPSDPRFHQQMVYAVASAVYASFRLALGRHVVWGFEDRGEGRDRKLVIRPHVAGQNAFYDKQSGTVSFGYYQASSAPAGNNLPGGWIYTCLSHDIVAHEMTHALLDGLRASFTIPTGPDVLAFHEGFADLIAIFQRFSYERVVETALRRAHGDVARDELLTAFARQFAETTDTRTELRSAIEVGADGRPKQYDATKEPHELGSILVAAVFDAFVTLYRRKTERHILLATNGTGELPRGELPTRLLQVLTQEANQLGNQFLNMCIRAIDYCPPVDLTFGEYLRALITADYDLVPDDPWGYREALIDAFRSRKIYPPDVTDLSEDALLWREPLRPVAPIANLHCTDRPSAGESRERTVQRLRRQAAILGRFVTDPDRIAVFGLMPARPGVVDRPCIESVRAARRVGPDGQLTIDCIVEITQRRTATAGGRPFQFHGGVTLIVDSEGRIRYAIYKRTGDEKREGRQEMFIASKGGKWWELAGDGYRPAADMFRTLHLKTP